MLKRRYEAVSINVFTYPRLRIYRMRHTVNQLAQMVHVIPPVIWNSGLAVVSRYKV